MSSSSAYRHAIQSAREFAKRTGLPMYVDRAGDSDRFISNWHKTAASVASVTPAGTVRSLRKKKAAAAPETRRAVDRGSYSTRPARYAKNMIAVVDTADETGMKSRRQRLLHALGFRWVNRERAYLGSAAKVRKFEQLYRDGWDAEFFGKKLVAPR